MKFMWDNKTKFNLFSISIANQVGLKISSLDILYQNNEIFIENYLKEETQKEVDKINQRDVLTIPDDELYSLTQSISNYHGLSHETKEVLSHYMIVATFSFYEKGLKKILSLTNKLSDRELKNCYQKDALTQHLNQKFSITYSSLTDYDKIEELRCLNNCIKHNDSVGDELVAANNKWILNNTIENTFDDFERLKTGPTNLLQDLITRLEFQILNSLLLT